MTRAELIELIRNDENSGVEFKRDDVSATKLAAEIAALLNLRGGGTSCWGSKTTRR